MAFGWRCQSQWNSADILLKFKFIGQCFRKKKGQSVSCIYNYETVTFKRGGVASPFRSHMEVENDPSPIPVSRDYHLGITSQSGFGFRLFSFSNSCLISTTAEETRKPAFLQFHHLPNYVLRAYAPVRRLV